ncbi:DUF2634 domain-containing protein [Rummeliibacillus sp. NPDC094406]|uniref:DUF2634 domain-containing protein n=1 Tax=Rummeliibacillus sp. NPDC094406 TaxID=3364511 RepID=UPI00382DF227
MLPDIAELEFNTDTEPKDLPKLGKSFLYDFDKGDFVLKDGKMVEIHGVEVLKQWILKVLKTERFRFRIYENIEYGVTLEDLIGSSFPRSFVEAEIKREVTASLILHSYIESVEDWTFEHDGKWMKVWFTVVTIDGAFEMEVTF